MTLSLDGHVALVTGAGRSIGRAHATLLATRGAKVICCDLGVELDGSGSDVSVAEAVASEIRAAAGQHREYRMERRRDTELVTRLAEALADIDSG